MGFAVSRLRENRLKGFSADNSYHRHKLVAGLELC